MPYGPGVTEGTGTVHENEPSPSTYTVPSLHEELEPPKYGVTRSADVNPEPVNVTMLPTSPLEGLNVREGVTVNDPTAIIGPSSDVDAAIAYGPAGEAGTATVHVNDPSLVTSTIPSIHEALEPPKDGVTASVAVNPRPFSTTSLPTTPVEGSNASEG
jgi:hypothetical protein